MTLILVIIHLKLILIQTIQTIYTDKNHFHINVSKHKSISLNSLLIRINSFKINSIKINFYDLGTKHTLRACLFWLFGIKKCFYNPQKWKIEFPMMFGLAFKNCFYPPKAIILKATIPTFSFPRINSTLNLIFWLLKPIIFLYCLLSILLLLAL